MEEPTEINFYKCHGGGAANGGEGKCRGRERSWQGAGFLLLRTISYFTYEMANNQSKTTREGNVIKLSLGNGWKTTVPMDPSPFFVRKKDSSHCLNSVYAFYLDYVIL